MQFKLILFSLFITLLSPLSFAETQTKIQLASQTDSDQAFQPKGATCVIRDNNGQVILVQDYLTRTLSLPGGYIDSSETFQAAAKRETLEETGITVTVGHSLP